MNSYHKAVVDIIKKVQSFFESTFVSINVDGPKLDPEALGREPLMLVSTHRSHVDYFLLGYVFNSIGLKNLRFAAGDNLTSLPWIGPRFKAFGAFPVSRDTGFDRHYVRNLCNDVVGMLEKGDTVLVFPEGGRSYSGAMLEMRIGVLGASVIAQAHDLSRDVRYIPVAVSYDCPPDAPWFNMQIKGKRLRKHSNPLHKRLIGNMLYFGADIAAFVPLLLAKYFRKKYGRIYVDYGEPVSIRSIMDVEANRTAVSRDEFSSHRVSMQSLGEKVYGQLSSLYRLLPVHIVAAQLQAYRRRSLTDCADLFPSMIADLRSRGKNVKELQKFTSAENAQTGIAQLLKLGAVTYRRNVCTVRNEALVRYFAAAAG